MKNKTNRTLLAALIVSSLLSPAAMAACNGTVLDTCPAPFDTKLPDAHTMLTWSQADRVVGFRNDYRNYAGDVFRAMSVHVHELDVDAVRERGRRRPDGGDAQIETGQDAVVDEHHRVGVADVDLRGRPALAPQGDGDLLVGEGRAPDVGGDQPVPRDLDVLDARPRGDTLDGPLYWRGGGDPQTLLGFNDERLLRAVAG